MSSEKSISEDDLFKRYIQPFFLVLIGTGCVAARAGRTGVGLSGGGYMDGGYKDGWRGRRAAGDSSGATGVSFRVVAAQPEAGQSAQPQSTQRGSTAHVVRASMSTEHAE